MKKQALKPDTTDTLSPHIVRAAAVAPSPGNPTEDRQTDGHTDGQTERRAGRQTEEGRTYE